MQAVESGKNRDFMYKGRITAQLHGFGTVLAKGL